MKITPLIHAIQKAEQEGKKICYRLVAWTIGTNELIDTNSDNIKLALDKLFAGQRKKGCSPSLWDGHAAERIVDIFFVL